MYRYRFFLSNLDVVEVYADSYADAIAEFLV
jgi:hypothetical protein